MRALLIVTILSSGFQDVLSQDAAVARIIRLDSPPQVPNVSPGELTSNQLVESIPAPYARSLASPPPEVSVVPSEGSGSIPSADEIEDMHFQQYPSSSSSSFSGLLFPFIASTMLEKTSQKAENKISVPSLTYDIKRKGSSIPLDEYVRTGESSESLPSMGSKSSMLPSLMTSILDRVSSSSSQKDENKQVGERQIPHMYSSIPTMPFPMPGILSMASSSSSDEDKHTNSATISSPLSALTSVLGLFSKLKKGFSKKGSEEYDDVPANSRSSSVSNLESVPILGNINNVLDKIDISYQEGKEEVRPMEKVKTLVSDIMSNIMKAKATVTETILSKTISSKEETRKSSFVLDDVKKLSRSSIVGSFLSLLGGHGKKDKTETAVELRGPHICVKETNKKHLKPNATINLEKECETFPQAVRCVQRRIIAEGWLETTRIQECCDGFTADDITKGGCGKELVPEILESLMFKYNVSDVPRDLLISTLMFSKDSPSQVTVFPSRIMDYDLIDGVILTSVYDNKYIVSHDKEEKSTHINCVRLNKTNIFLENGMAIVTEEEVTPAEKTILDMLQKDGRFNFFLSILSSEAKEKLDSSSTSFNVMPFTDTSFETFSQDIQKQLKANKTCVIKAIEKYHIFEGAACSHKLMSSSSPAEIVTTSSKTQFIGGAKIVETDGVALNGIVHVVDEVITREKIESWVEKLKEIDPLTTTFMEKEIKDQEPITIFVPTSPKLQTGDDVLNHVISLQISSVDDSPSTITTVGNSTIFAGKFPHSKHVSIFGPKTNVPLQFGCSRVISHPKAHQKLISACGASIIFLDKPLPKVNSTMEEFLASRSEISRFASLYDTYSFNNTLPPVSTLFIPVDDAFAVNTFKKFKNDPAAINNLIKSHLVSRPICEHDIESCKREVRGEIVNEVGKRLKIGGEEGQRTVGSSKILETVVVSDGVVHLMEDVLPSAKDAQKGKKPAPGDFPIFEDWFN